MNELRYLEVFRAVAKTASFTQAAHDLHVSQPVVSRSVRDLERSLGVRLFDRTTRSVALTSEGRELLVVADDVLHRVDDAMERFAGYCRGERGRVVIAALPSIAATVLPALLSTFLATYPGMTVEITDTLTTEAIREVQSGRADLAIAEPSADMSGLQATVVRRDRFVAVLPPGHRLARRRSLTWKDLAGEPFIAMSRESSVRRLTDIAMIEARVAPTTVVEARNIATAGGIISAGLGVSAFPELVLPLLSHAPIVTRPLIGPAMYRDIALITPAEKEIAPPAQRFVAVLRATLEGP